MKTSPLNIKNTSLLRVMQGLMLALTLHLSTAVADVKPLPDVDPKFVTITETNPTRDAGYVVGDMLDRTVVIAIKKPYELVKESLPIVGYEHRWKGQLIGVELVDIKTKEKLKSDSATHTLDLRYQVFTTSKTVKHASLKAEILQVRNLQTKEVFQLRIPFFDFRVSPLSIFGQVKLHEDLSPFVPPLLLDAGPEKRNLTLLAVLLGASLLGLLYIFGVYAWLPKMGGPFAKAYRDIRKMPDNAEGLQNAVARVHQSLNRTAGNSLFASNIAEFVASKPAFAPVSSQIQQFFNLSKQVFFEPNAAVQLDDNPKAWLLKFCRQLRDCERGLRPENKQKANA